MQSPEHKVNEKMNKIQKTTSYLIGCAFTGFLLYTGVYLGMLGFMNLLSYWICIGFVYALLVALSEVKNLLRVTIERGI